jgi:hypothetical protein
LYASGGRVDISGSLFLNGVAITATAAFPYTGSAQITGSLGVTGSIAATSYVQIGQNWRLRESGVNLLIEKWNGSAWVQTDIFS